MDKQSYALLGVSERKSKTLRSDNDYEREAALQSVLDDNYTSTNKSFSEEAEDIDPSWAMKQMLNHVKVDPDGGVLNLLEEFDDEHSKQHSKISALTKGFFESCLAMFALFRTISNPALVAVFAVIMLHGYHQSHVDWIAKINKLTSQERLPLPIIECFVIVALAELAGVMILLTITFRHALQAFCSASDAVRYGVHPRYMALAELYWHDLPYLQSFSALAPLAFIHPNLLTKNLKTFSIREDLARAKLERFLGLPDNSESDETIVRRVLATIVNYQNFDQDRRKVASEHLESSPYRVLSFLQESTVAQDHDHLRAKGMDPDAVQGCRFSCLLCCELLGLFTCAIVCFLAGSLAFMTKIVRAFSLFIDQDAPPYVPVVFFLLFLNQSMGILSLSRLLTWRIETFMFGGPDAQVSSEEAFMSRFYLGCLVEAVWRNTKLTWFEKMCVMFQLDDDDLQQLVIEDASRAKAVLLLQIRKYMRHTKAAHPKYWFKSKVINFIR